MVSRIIGLEKSVGQRLMHIRKGGVLLGRSRSPACSHAREQSSLMDYCAADRMEREG